MQILITGATGFLGSHLAEKLIKSGHKIFILKRSFSNLWRIKHFLKDIVCYDVDKSDITKPFVENKIDVVIHAATVYGRQQENISEIVESNLCFPLSVLKTAAQFKTRVFVNTDTALSRNLNNYTLSKKQFVEWMQKYSDRMKIINLKFEHLYGEKDDASKFIPYLIRELLFRAKEIKLTKGEQKRDFIYIKDAVEAYNRVLLSCRKAEKGFYDYIVGSGEARTIKEIVNLIKTIAGTTDTVLNFGVLEYRKNEAMESCADISKINKETGWQPKISLETGLTRTVRWYKDNLEKMYG